MRARKTALKPGKGLEKKLETLKAASPGPTEQGPPPSRCFQVHCHCHHAGSGACALGSGPGVPDPLFHVTSHQSKKVGTVVRD